jgi:hypothetical protein
MAEPGRANKYYLSHIQYDKPAELDTASILESEQYWMPIKLAETKNRAKGNVTWSEHLLSSGGTTQ